MSQEELDNLVRIGRLKAEPGSRNEFAGMVNSARRRLLGAITVLDSTSRVSDLSGRLRAALGLVVPLVLDFVGHGRKALGALAAVLVLVGGFILRYVIVMSIQS